jgi:hypothetical protein
MNCGECKEILSVFLDNELDESRAVLVRSHLAACAGCAAVCEDLSSILFACKDAPEADGNVPLNSQAMWCRINNIIESEVKPPVEPETPQGRFWRLSLGQMASAAAAIIVISSLITVVAIRNYMQPGSDDLTTRSAATQTTFEKVLSRVGLIDTPQQALERRMEQQRSAIAYWDSRVQARRAQWVMARRGRLQEQTVRVKVVFDKLCRTGAGAVSKPVEWTGVSL